MIIGKRLKGKAIAAWLGPTGDVARRAFTAVRERVRGDAHAHDRLDVYLDIADAWSYLAAQIADRLIRAYGVDFAVHVVTPPAADVDGSGKLRPRHAVRDAQQMVEYWNLEFPGKKEADAGIVRDVAAVLVKERSHADQLRAALELFAAMWITDRKRVATLMGTWGAEAHIAAPSILNERYAELRKAGHYQAAMFQYGGEWYGVERFAALEAAIAAHTGKPVANVVAARPIEERGPLSIVDANPKAGTLRCELWFSFRSPFSYLALEQIEPILAGSGVPLVLRPIQPMVVRAQPMPTVKKLYLVRDAKREADRLGIPFGEICDPIGAAVDRCLAVAYWAERRSPADALAFARSAMRGIWSEARDMNEYVDLRAVVERAQLPWEEARAALADHEAAAKWAAANATDLAVYGMWGVPSFRCGELVAWGQDRLPLLADRLRRHALVPPAPPPAPSAEPPK